MSNYGSAVIVRNDDGTVTVTQADPVIGISFELLAEAEPHLLWVDGEGLLWLGGDPRYRYRPIRFESTVSGIPQGMAVEGTRMLICERVGGNDPIDRELARRAAESGT
jgi:hypothetical protein